VGNWRNGPLKLQFLTDQPQFPRPVRERQAQTLQVRMPGPDSCFDFRDFAAATGDSCSRSDPLLGDFRERPAVSIQDRVLAGQLLPSD
jgi:hypothetical protein